MVTIKKVEGKKDLARFIDFPHELYKDDPNYVPELFIAQRDMLDVTKKKNLHPFHLHSKLDLFLAENDGKIVGRIAAIRNNNHIAYTGLNEGFFGFFDVENNYEVAKKLFDTVVEWQKKEKLTGVSGPVNFSTNETCGLLIEGFDSPPVVMMTYNRKYYADFLDKYGFKKKMDMFAYLLDVKTPAPELMRMQKLLSRRLESKGITIRTANMKKFGEETERLKGIYNSAWEKNWGFVPMTDDEFRYMAKDLKMIVDPDFCLLAEHNGKTVGFALVLPDINVILRTIKKGRLLPTGIFKLLFQKKKIKLGRIITLGVIDGYRKMGIDAVFYSMIWETAARKNYDYGEASWILESNEMMNRAMINAGGRVYKKYRIYDYKF